MLKGNEFPMFKLKKILFICISLKQSTERRQKISTEIEKLRKHITEIEISFEFFDGIYGKNLAPEYLSFINIARAQAGQCKRPLGSSEIGCLFSHLFIWQRQAEGNYSDFDRVIILEDDVFLNSNLINEKLVEISYSKEDFIFLGGHTKQSRTRIYGYEAHNSLSFTMLGPSDLYTAACAYSITENEAKKLLNKIIMKPTFVDDWKYLLADKHSISYYFCFEQGGKNDSSINHDRLKYKIKNKNIVRLKKNSMKIFNDINARLKAFFSFKKTTRLSLFLTKNKEDAYK